MIYQLFVKPYRYNKKDLSGVSQGFICIFENFRDDEKKNGTNQFLAISVTNVTESVERVKF